MRVQEVMTSPAIGVISSSNIAEAAKLMVEHRISGLPVVDASRNVLGMITEGDLLRRSELGTEAKRPDWQSLFASSGKLADEYAHSHGRKVEEVMSPNAITIAAAAALGEAVELMLKHRVKRLPVVSKQGEMVGIVSRSDIVKALLAALPAEVPVTVRYATPRARSSAEFTTAGTSRPETERASSSQSSRTHWRRDS